MQHWSEEERKKALEPLLSSVKAVYRWNLGGQPELTPGAKPGPSSPKSEARQAIGQDALQLLVSAAWRPWLTLGEHYANCGLRGNSGPNAVKELEIKNLVRKHVRPRRGSGAPPQLLEVTVEGGVELKMRELRMTKLEGRGGFMHGVYIHDLIEMQRRACREVWADKQIQAKAYDCGGEYKNGGLWCAEVYLSGSAKDNAEGIVRGLQPGVSELWVLSDDDEMLAKMKKLVESKVEHEVAQRVRYLFVGDIYQRRE